MTKQTHPTVKAVNVQQALEEWALNEIRATSDRYHELSKFYFTATAASFAVLPFFSDVGFEIVIQSLLGPLIVLSIAMALVIWINFPVSFCISADTDLAREHRKYSQQKRCQSILWAILWGIGVVWLVINVAMVET